MKREALRRLLVVLAGLCALAAIWFGYSFWSAMKEYEHGEEDLKRIYEAMGDSSIQIPRGEYMQMDEAEKQKVKEHLMEQRLENCEKLKHANSDTIGRIWIEGTIIDYPVMQTPDNPDYYLKHGFDKGYSAYGMIYMDASCSLEEGCKNYLLYGHHMKNGSMFASLENYTDEEYYKEHPIIGFDTMEEAADYEVAAVIKLPASMITAEFSHMLAAETKEDYDSLIAYLKKHGFYDTGITPEWPEQLLTLTTCEYSQKNGRLLVIARRAAN